MNTPIPHRIRPLGRLPLFRATALAALLVALALLTTPTDLAHAGGGPNCHGDWDVCFDLNEGLIVGEGFADETTFMGVPYTATVGEDLTRFFIAGSLDLQGPLTIDFTDDSNLASIWIRGDLRVAPGVVFDASGFERRRGPGGGRGGNDRNGGDGAEGGDRGTSGAGGAGDGGNIFGGSNGSPGLKGGDGGLPEGDAQSGGGGRTGNDGLNNPDSGGGGGASCGPNAGGNGANGGVGGVGGDGGRGGSSGDGGGGAGGLEIFVFGRLEIDGSILARGAPGQRGSDGDSGSSGGDGQGGGGGSSGDGGPGGDGGNGADGGNGSAGARGGDGAGGAGGTILVVASVLDSEAVFDAAGGTGGTLDAAGADDDEEKDDPGDGDDGRVIIGRNAGPEDVGTVVGRRQSDVVGPVGPNPLISGNPDTPYIPGLDGGPELYALTGLSDADLGALSSPPGEAVAALLLLEDGPPGFDDGYPGFDMLLLVNLSGGPLLNPRLGAGGPGFRTALLQGGVDADPAFGGSAPMTIETLGTGEVYATLIPEGTTDFSASVDVDGETLSVSPESLTPATPTFIGGDEPAPPGNGGGPPPEGTLAVEAGGQFVFWTLGPASASDWFTDLRIAWFFNDEADPPVWISFVPPLGVTDFPLFDGAVLWLVSPTDQILAPDGG